MQLTDLSDEALVSQLSAICLEGHRLTARLVEYLIEVEERRLDLKAACTSMFDFCVRRLGMSEGAAFRRINAARLVRRFPALLARIESGELHLSTLVLLRPHLMHVDDAKAAALVAAVAGKTRREVAELLARIAPRPDVPSLIEQVPEAHVQVELGSRGGEPVVAPASAAASRTTLARTTSARTTSAQIEPLSESRFKVQLTASAELKGKLERARDLMSHRNPSGDLAVVVERALDLLLDALEKERLGKVARPTSPTSPARRPATPRRSAKPRASGARAAIPRAVRREVFTRDGEACTFVDAEGHRCASHIRLELDHVESWALGGADDAANLRAQSASRGGDLRKGARRAGRRLSTTKVAPRHGRRAGRPAGELGARHRIAEYRDRRGAAWPRDSRFRQQRRAPHPRCRRATSKRPRGNAVGRGCTARGDRGFDVMDLRFVRGAR